MEKKDWKKWRVKNSGLQFGLCLMGVAAFSVLFASSQVKQAQKEKEQMLGQQTAGVENEKQAPDAGDRNGSTALEKLAAARTLEEMSEGMQVSAADDITAQMEKESEVQTENGENDASAVNAKAEADGDAGAGEAEVSAEPEGEGVLAAQSAQILPELSFDESSALNWPVAGSVVLDYSMDGSIYFPTLKQYKYNPALVIGSDTGAQVVAAAKGVVKSIAYSDEIGTTVTMDLGDGYELIYGQLQDVAVSEGEVAEQGQLIGYVSDPTKYYCVEGSNLFFEMTKDGAPVDPVMYLE